MFKKPQKKTAESSNIENSQEETNNKRAEIDLIFNLDKEGNEIQKEEEIDNDQSEIEQVSKKKFLDDEDTEISYGLQIKKTRFIDRQSTAKSSTADSLPAAKVLARESKAGNKKLLSFYDEEQEEIEEFNRDKLDEEIRKQEEEEDSD